MCGRLRQVVLEEVQVLQSSGRDVEEMTYLCIYVWLAMAEDAIDGLGVYAT